MVKYIINLRNNYNSIKNDKDYNGKKKVEES